MKTFLKISVLLFVVLQLFLGACKKDGNDGQPQPSDSTASIVVLYTSDEHGWMEASGESDGATGLMGAWTDKENYDGSDKYLIMSGGDMWTGPAISTWFNGISMVEVMNAMEYDAAALGNHEFDFSDDTLKIRAQEMSFPILAANVRLKSSGEVPDFIKPFEIIETSGVKVGILGLASIYTPNLTFPNYVDKYDFISYENAIMEYVPIVKNAGAKVLMIIGHICKNEMETLVPLAKTHGISLIAGGHCHDETTSTEVDGVLLLRAGSGMNYYAKAELLHDLKSGQTFIQSFGLRNNNTGHSDVGISQIVQFWQNTTNNLLGEEIGYCNSSIGRSSVEMGNMVTDTWLWSFPNADISVTNSGGIRQDIPAGVIKLETIVGLLPFNNVIVELEMTGTGVIDCIDNYLIGGMTTVGGYYLSNGTPIYSDSIYTVLTTDFLYFNPSSIFSDYDPDPYFTSIQYRQPVIDWIKSLGTSASKPLNNYLDYTPRREEGI